MEAGATLTEGSRCQAARLGVPGAGSTVVDEIGSFVIEDSDTDAARELSSEVQEQKHSRAAAMTPRHFTGELCPTPALLSIAPNGRYGRVALQGLSDVAHY